MKQSWPSFHTELYNYREREHKLEKKIGKKKKGKELCRAFFLHINSAHVDRQRQLGCGSTGSKLKNKMENDYHQYHAGYPALNGSRAIFFLF